MGHKEREKRFLDKVAKFAKKAEYPIKDRDSLVRLFGGEDGVIEWDGEQYRTRQAAQIVPDYLFPVESDEDLRVKALNLELSRPDRQPAFDAAPEQRPDDTRRAPREQVGKPPKQVTRKEGGPALVVGRRGRDT